MSSFQFAPQQFPQRETQKNYVFVDEHNRHKRLKVMRACEGCRRRKIKCDAATTNTWPCSACIRLKLTCVRPNGYDGAPDSSSYDAPMHPTEQFHHMSMQQASMHTAPKPGASVYQPQSHYADPNSALYQGVPFDPSHSQPPGVNYTTVPPHVSALDQPYHPQSVFPTQVGQPQQEPSPEAYSPDSYQQGDLADLLGSLKVDEKGTAPYLRNKASFRRETSEPVVDDDDEPALPPISLGPGSKVRIPPELMPEEEDCLRYIDAFFTQVHPYIPVLNRSQFIHQWNNNRESISPLVVEAIFALGGRLRDDPSDGQQWLALATRHADAFMDVPRLSTLQGLLLLLKAREATPKKGYYYRSWMTVVHCVQMGKDLGLDEHYEEHELGQGCEFSMAECQLRTRIWQTVFVCEVMVGAPQARHDLSVSLDTIDFEVPDRVPGIDEGEYQTSRNFTYLARVVRNVKKMSSTYSRIRKKPEWGIDPELQQLTQGFDAFLTELPSDLSVQFPQDGSPPWLPSPFIGNLLSYFYLTLILYHRPQLQASESAINSDQWKHHMMVCYDSAKALCKLQEAVINIAGLEGLQCMQRGYSFTVYAGLSCIVLHLVAITSPDPDLNTDARAFFTRQMRIMEKVMDVWAMPEVRLQVEAVRDAFSADTRKAFVLKPTFPYGSPHPSNTSSPPRSFRPPMERAATASFGQHLDSQNAQNVSYARHPISPPVSAGTLESKGDSPSGQPLMMNQAGQNPGMDQSLGLPEHPSWNPARIFEQWNNSFGTPSAPEPSSATTMSPSTAANVNSLQNYSNMSSMQSAAQQITPPQYTAPQIPNFVTPAMWQESVATVYEGGLKRTWDYDGGPVMKHR